MVSTVIFDLDNTLINRKMAFQSYTEKFVERFIHIPNEDKLKEIIEYIITADQNGYRKKRELYEEFLNNLVIKNEQTTVEEMLEYWFSEFFKCSILMNGATEVLECLKAQGIKLGIITNGSIYSQNAKIDAVGIRHYFDTIIISDEVGFKKPDPQIFRLALKNLNTTAEKSWFVGDHPTNDIKGALDAGLHAVWLSGFMDWDLINERPRNIINHLFELIKIIGSF
jgi:putative hydrolase of the HAD superfamily